MALQVDHGQVEYLSKLRMGVTDICDCLGYPVAEFHAEMDTDPLVKKAIKQGRACAIRDAAEVVQNTVDGSFTGLPDKQSLKLRAALEFLDRHSPEWRPVK